MKSCYIYMMRTPHKLNSGHRSKPDVPFKPLGPTTTSGVWSRVDKVIKVDLAAITVIKQLRSGDSPAANDRSDYCLLYSGSRVTAPRSHVSRSKTVEVTQTAVTNFKEYGNRVLKFNIFVLNITKIFVKCMKEYFLIKIEKFISSKTYKFKFQGM